MNKILILLLLMGCMSFSQAKETKRVCGTQDNLEIFLKNNPKYKDSITHYEKKTQAWIETKGRGLKRPKTENKKDSSPFLKQNKSTSTNAICGYNNSYFTTVNAPFIEGFPVSPNLNCIYGGEYIRVLELQVGNTYRISTIGVRNFDTILTIYSENGNEVVAYNDDTPYDIGVFQSEIYFTPFISGNYDILVNEFGCFSNELCANIEIELVYKPRPVITIPIVVHVIHSGEDIGVGSNISDEQIISQIVALNEDFRRFNTNINGTNAAFRGVSADPLIEFCLAQQDPNGNPTNGIMRYLKPTIQEYQDDEVPLGFQCLNIATMETVIKPSTIWNRDDYLNIWVSEGLKVDSSGKSPGCVSNGDTLGYAQFPGTGGPLAPDVPAELTDGVWMLNVAFGTIGNLLEGYALGKTTTHEVGHWLNLRHIWGDATEVENGCEVDDEVLDTPKQNTKTFGFPSFPLTDDCSTLFPGIMYMNHMDYTFDNYKAMFTYGQSIRMDAALFTSRASLLNSLGCQSSTLGSKSYSEIESFKIYPNPTNSIVNFNNSNAKFETLEVISVFGQSLLKIKLVNINTIDISQFERGVYLFKFSKQDTVSTFKVVKE